MQDYDDLAAELREKAAVIEEGKQFWVGIAGGPGSGKSTLTDALKARLGDLATVIGLDGYHYYRRELDAMDDPEEAYVRRGAPFTFNAERFVSELVEARQSGEGVFPSFDHGVGDPVEGDIPLTKDQRVVLVEGNYVLLDDEPWRRLREEVFDETWFMDVPVEECNRRVAARHVTVGLTEEQAQVRVDTIDGINAVLIAEVSPKNADKMVRITWVTP